MAILRAARRGCWLSFLLLAALILLVGCGQDGQEVSGPRLSDPSQPLVLSKVEGGVGRFATFSAGQAPGQANRQLSSSGSQPSLQPVEDSLAKVVRETILARSGTASSWYRFPLQWSLDGSAASLPAVTLQDPLAAYVTDAAIAFTRPLPLSRVDGTYPFNFKYANSAGTTLTFDFVYTVSGGGTQATLTESVNGRPLQTIYQGAALDNFVPTLGLSLARDPFISLNPDGYLEQFTVGTWKVTENINGVAGEVGSFDVRLLAIKNFRADPAQFNPSTNTTTFTADLVALPPPNATTITPGGWQPSEDVQWRLAFANSATPANIVQTFENSSTVSPPDSNGKVGSLSLTWDGKNSSGQVVPSGAYRVVSNALGSVLGGGNALTRKQTSTVTVGTRFFEVQNAAVDPESFNPKEKETQSLSFDLVARDFRSPTFQWQATVENASGTFFQLPLVSSANPAPYNVTVAPDGNSVHVQVTWNGKNASGQIIDGDYRWVIHALACAGGQGTTPNLAPFSGDAHQSESCLPGEATVVAMATPNKLEFFQNKKSVTSVEPSFLFRVHQFAEVLERKSDQGGVPSTRTGQMVDMGKASLVEVRFTLNFLPGGQRPPGNLTLEVTPKVGYLACGHLHTNPMPTGLLLKDAVLPTASNLADQVTDSVAVSGSISFSVTKLGDAVKLGWIVPIVSGKYDFTVRNASGIGLASKSITAEKAGFTSLDQALQSQGITFQTVPTNDARGAGLFLTGADFSHKANHYGTPEFNTHLITLVKSYQRFLKSLTLRFNDMSLPCGGKFDINANYKEKGNHFEHRMGENVDMNNDMVLGNQRDPFLERQISKAGLGVYVEGNHYHLRLLEGGTK